MAHSAMRTLGDMRPARRIGPERSKEMGAPDLIADANVLLHDRRAQVMARPGMSCETVSARDPRISYAGVPGATVTKKEEA